MSRYPASLRRELYRLGLEQNILPPQGAYPRPAMRVAPFYESYGVQFMWDLPYSTYAVARFGKRVDLARGFVENMVAFAVADGPDAGMIPRSVTIDGDQAGQDGSQTPLLAWLTMELHRLEPDEEFLRRVYPRLAGFISWWQSPRRDFDGDGLSEYAGSTPTYVSYEGLDFSPERDLVMGEPTAQSDDGLVHEPFADVFLNASLYGELDALAAMAATVAPGEKGMWEARRDALAARMREAMWDEEVGGFFPAIRRDLCPSQPRVIRHTPAMLQPLWAGLASQSEADRTAATLRGVTANYPHHDGAMRITIDPALYHGYAVSTDGLHPTRGEGAAAGGVELLGPDGAQGLVVRFGEDRGPAAETFARVGVEVTTSDAGPGAHIVAEVENARGRVCSVVDRPLDGKSVVGGLVGADPSAGPGAPPWTPGLRRVEVRSSDCRVTKVTVTYSRMQRSGLLSPFGVKSAHPLDGKHPAPGAPTQFWSGTIWAPQVFHACYGLARYGFGALAAASARAFCDATATSYAAGGEAFEHLSHENGAGLGTYDYTWTAAVALVLMEDFVDVEED